MSSKFATVMVQFVPAAFVIGAGMELFMLNTVSAESQMSNGICSYSNLAHFVLSHFLEHLRQPTDGSSTLLRTVVQNSDSYSSDGQ